MNGLLTRVERQYGAFVVLDLHSYNYRREGPDGPPADPAGNPVVNVGTGNTDAVRWRALIDGFIDDLSAFDTGAEPLDVRENVKFTGGDFTRWVHGRFPTSSCCLAVEFKKTFMDEWSGVLDEKQLGQLLAALARSIRNLLQVNRLRGVPPRRTVENNAPLLFRLRDICLTGIFSRLCHL